MRPEEMGSLPLQVEKLFYGLQDRIMSDVVRRIKKTGEITSTADYQLNRIKILGNSSEFIEDELKRLLNVTYPELFALYDKVIDWEYVRNKDIYEQVNGQFTPPEENNWLQELSSAIVSQTEGDIKNITRSLGFSLDYGDGKKVFTPLSEYYQKYLDRACLDIASGAFDYNTALRRVVREMTSSGIRSVDYASGYSNRAPVAARRAVMTGVHNLSNKINEQLAKELETDDFEVTAHYGAQPTHAVWQGRVYSRRELESICGLGSVAGLCGANCNHSYLPFIRGISTRTYTDEMLEDIREDDARIRRYRGKEYDGYTCRQRQREMETTMRAQRQRIKYLKEGGDHDAVLAAQAKYLQTLHEYKGFSKIMGLQPQMERVYMDGLGRMAGGRIPAKAVVKSGRSGIIKSGAVSGARNPYGDAANKHAEKYYGLVRKMKTDVARIAKTTGIPEQDIQSIKDYLFIQKHDLGGSEKKRFDPDYMIGESWKRLIDGKPESHDLTLIKHEIMEKDLMSKGMSQDEAHIAATAKYNYDKEATLFYGKIKKFKKE